jgi:uncharacterized protein
MTATENRELLRAVFDEMATGNVRALGDALADEARWTFPGEWSWAGTWAPKREVVNGLLRPLMDRFEGYRSEATQILADGDRVVVQARSDATTRRGDRYDQTYCFVFRVADGRIVEVVEHCDTALVERVLGSPPPR